MDDARESAHSAPEKPPSEPAAWLVERHSGMAFPVADRAEVSVGRADPKQAVYPDVDLTAVDAGRTVSRRHARLRRDGDGFILAEDGETVNGTYVNGVRVGRGQAVPVNHGDLVTIGSVMLSFDADGASRRTEDSASVVDEPFGELPAPAPVVEPDVKAPLRFTVPGAPVVAFGLNQNVDYEGRVYHAQTEDIGREEVILTVVYAAGTVVFSRRTPYSVFRERRGEDFTPAQMVRFQHRGVVAGVREGRHLERRGAEHSPLQPPAGGGER